MKRLKDYRRPGNHINKINYLYFLIKNSLIYYSEKYKMNHAKNKTKYVFIGVRAQKT